MFMTFFRGLALLVVLFIVLPRVGRGDFVSPANNSQYTGGEPISIQVDVPYTLPILGSADPEEIGLGLLDDEDNVVETWSSVDDFTVTNVYASQKYVVTYTYTAPYNSANYSIICTCEYENLDAERNRKDWFVSISVDYD